MGSQDSRSTSGLRMGLAGLQPVAAAGPPLRTHSRFSVFHKLGCGEGCPGGQAQPPGLPARLRLALPRPAPGHVPETRRGQLEGLSGAGGPSYGGEGAAWLSGPLLCHLYPLTTQAGPCESTQSVTQSSRVPALVLLPGPGCRGRADGAAGPPDLCEGASWQEPAAVPRRPQAPSSEGGPCLEVPLQPGVWHLWDLHGQLGPGQWGPN